MSAVIAMRLRENCFKGLMYLSLFVVLPIWSSKIHVTTPDREIGMKKQEVTSVETKTTKVKKEKL
ncbi:MAG TPA: hypothetical protein VG737_08680 [Cyclobacteriaceae bacterium]|nr:hypothetical protein [Cyclobacteriaceae bacterium]